MFLLAFPRLAYRRSMKRVLGKSIDRAALVQIWTAAKFQQQELKPLRPRHSFGVNFILPYFEWSIALYRSLIDAGHSHEEAGQWVEEVNWDALGPAICSAYPLSRIHSKNPQARLGWVNRFLFQFVFTAPYEYKIIPNTNDLHFDVTVCPFAQYFADRGIPELTAFAACNLDHRMADKWGVKLERTETLAEQKPRCDFRFSIDV